MLGNVHLRSNLSRKVLQTAFNAPIWQVALVIYVVEADTPLS